MKVLLGAFKEYYEKLKSEQDRLRHLLIFSLTYVIFFTLRLAAPEDGFVASEYSKAGLPCRKRSKAQSNLVLPFAYADESRPSNQPVVEG